jgi:hypothetical protein
MNSERGAANQPAAATARFLASDEAVTVASQGKQVGTHLRGELEDGVCRFAGELMHPGVSIGRAREVAGELIESPLDCRTVMFRPLQPLVPGIAVVRGLDQHMGQMQPSLRRQLIEVARFAGGEDLDLASATSPPRGFLDCERLPGRLRKPENGSSLLTNHALPYSDLQSLPADGRAVFLHPSS